MIEKNASIGIRGKSVDCKYRRGSLSREYREILCVTDAEDRLRKMSPKSLRRVMTRWTI